MKRIRADGPSGHLNRKTAVKIQLETLLVATTGARTTGHLAVSRGCWVKHESFIKHGVMTVVFLMNHTGYSVLADGALVPPGADVTARETYLQVATRH